MGSMMADLKGVHSGINLILKGQGKEPMLLDDLVVMLFEEVEYVWPRLGYPPLVTPFSQYVKNVALMNVMQRVKGEDRWTMIDNNTWDMILGKSGKLPGALAPEIIELAKSKGLQFTDEDPQSNYPDALDTYRKEMDENGWEYGEDDEELFELAMHDRQYRDYKSGVAKERFNKDLEAARAKAGAPIVVTRPVVEMPKYDVEAIAQKYPSAVPVQAPVKGQMLWEVDVDDVSTAPVAGTEVKAGEPMGYVQAYYGMEEIVPAVDGRVVAVCAKQGENVAKGEIVAFVEKKA